MTPSRGAGDIACKRITALRGWRHQLPPSFPRSPGIIPAVLSKGFSGLRAAAVLSRNAPSLYARYELVKVFLSTILSHPIRVNNR